MKFAFVIDDPGRVDYVTKDLLINVESLGECLGMKAFTAENQGRMVKLFFSHSVKGSVSLRTEDIFLFQDLDVIINIGYCYVAPNQKKVSHGENVIVGAARCSPKYKETLNIEEEQQKVEFDKSLEKKLLNAAEKQGITIKTQTCYSVLSLDEVQDINKEKSTYAIFDEKAFSLYETARKHNRHTICFYRARSVEDFDLQSQLTESKKNDSLNALIKLALEFEVKCRIK